jgi:hypothetical protein
MREISVLPLPVRQRYSIIGKNQESIAIVEASPFHRYWVPAENENNQDEADDDEVKFFLIPATY